jgi:hypothetical protein
MTPATAGAATLWRYLGAVEAGDERAVRSVVAETSPADVFLAAAMSLYEDGSVGLRITGSTVDGGEVVLRWVIQGRRHHAVEEEDFCRGVAVVRDAKIRSLAITPVARRDWLGGHDHRRHRDP